MVKLFPVRSGVKTLNTKAYIVEGNRERDESLS